MDNNSALEVKTIISMIKVSTQEDLYIAAAALMQLDQSVNASPDTTDVEMMSIDFFIGFESLNCQIRAYQTYNTQLPKLNDKLQPLGGFFCAPSGPFIFSKELNEMSLSFTQSRNEPTRAFFVRYLEFLNGIQGQEVKYFQQDNSLMKRLQKQVGLEELVPKVYQESIADQNPRLLNPEKAIFFYHLYILRPLLLVIIYLHQQNKFLVSHLLTVSYLDSNQRRQDSEIWKDIKNVNYKNCLLFRIMETIERFMELDKKYALNINTTIFYMIGEFLRIVYENVMQYSDVYQIDQKEIFPIKNKAKEMIQSPMFGRLIGIPISNFLDAYEEEEDVEDMKRTVSNELVRQCQFGRKDFIDEISRLVNSGVTIQYAIQSICKTINEDCDIAIVDNLSQNGLRTSYWLQNDIFTNVLPQELRALQVFVKFVHFVYQYDEFAMHRSNVIYYLKGISSVPPLLADMNKFYLKTSKFGFEEANKTIYVNAINTYLSFFSETEELSMSQLESTPQVISKDQFRTQQSQLKARQQVTFQVYSELKNLFGATPEFYLFKQSQSVFSKEVVETDLDELQQVYLGCGFNRFLQFSATQLWLSTINIREDDGAIQRQLTYLADEEVYKSTLGKLGVYLVFDSGRILEDIQVGEYFQFSVKTSFFLQLQFPQILKCTQNCDQECEDCDFRPKEYKHANFFKLAFSSPQFLLNSLSIDLETLDQLQQVLGFPHHAVICKKGKTKSIVQTADKVELVPQLLSNMFRFNGQVFVEGMKLESLVKHLQRSKYAIIVLMNEPRKVDKIFSYSITVYAAIVDFYLEHTNNENMTAICQKIRSAIQNQQLGSASHKCLYEQAMRAKKPCPELTELSLLKDQNQVFVIRPLDIAVLGLTTPMITVGVGCAKDYCNIYVQE